MMEQQIDRQWSRTVLQPAHGSNLGCPIVPAP
jgi:hypothetical protein